MYLNLMKRFKCPHNNLPSLVAPTGLCGCSSNKARLADSICEATSEEPLRKQSKRPMREAELDQAGTPCQETGMGCWEAMGMGFREGGW
jgi:hypothetical protein